MDKYFVIWICIILFGVCSWRIIYLLGIKTKEQNRMEHLRGEGMRLRAERAFGIKSEKCKCSICEENRSKYARI